MRLQETYRRIEESSTNSEKHPRVHSKRKAKGQADVEQLLRVGRGTRSGLGVGELGCREGEEEEQKGSRELAGHGDEMVADGVRQDV